MDTMLAYEFAEKRYCAFSADDRFHILRDKLSTLCGIGWQQMAGPGPARVATRADWTQCSLCAHEESQRQEVWQLESPDGPCFNGTEVNEDGLTGGPEE
jgi:hypothetical protein